jgi:hypothetical protein
MKWIKKFKEELKPITYRSAGYKLKRLGKLKRGSKLIDTGNIQETGEFNMHYANSRVIICRNGKFTSPRLINFYFGSPKVLRNSIEAPQYPTGNTANQLVNDWVNGRTDLSFTFEFGFQVTEETRMDKSDFTFGDFVPMFSITYLLSDWTEGLEEYNSEVRWDLQPGELEEASISDFYLNTQSNGAFIRRPNNSYFGIFSDRKSALSFKRFFDGVVDNNKDKIFDILSIVYPEAEELEKILKSLKSIRVNALYEEEIPKNWERISDLWYERKEIIN